MCLKKNCRLLVHTTISQGPVGPKQNFKKYWPGGAMEGRVLGYRSTGAAVFVVMDYGTKTKLKQNTGPTDQWKGEF